MLGYSFDTEQEAIDIIGLVNAIKGYPNESATTYCEYHLLNGKYVIWHDEASKMNDKFGLEPSEIDPQ